MRRRTRRLAVATGVALGLCAVGGFVDGALPEAGAQTVDSPVDYQVGDIRVFNTLTRNPSCSVSRVIRNVGPAPLFVVVTAQWDGQLSDDDPANNAGVFPQAQHSPYTEPTWLAPGEQTTAVWSNHGFLPNGPVRLGWSSILEPGVDVGATHVEFVSACAETPAPTVPPTVPTVPAPEPTVPVPVTDPPSVTVPPVPGTTAPLPPAVVPGPAPSTPDSGVLTSSVRRELPSTGASTAERAGLLAVLLLGAGAAVMGMRRGLPAGDRELDFEERG